jgi:hypothetical protein
MKRARVFHLIATILPWIIVLGVFAWLVAARFPLSGVVRYDAPLDSSRVWFHAFLPAERATSPGAQEGGWIGQHITKEPVYAEVRTPGIFDDVELSLEMRSQKQPTVRIGLSLLNNGVFVMTSVLPASTIPLQELPDGWKRVTVHFSPKSTLGFMRFMISAPGLTSNQGTIDVRHVTLTYRRAPLSFKNFFPLVYHELGQAWRRFRV